MTACGTEAITPRLAVLGIDDAGQKNLPGMQVNTTAPQPNSGGRTDLFLFQSQESGEGPLRFPPADLIGGCGAVRRNASPVSVGV